ncbi:MAG: hypothetical protein IT443_02575 [Phycisphaeraceae bacterium]|nr:hypothetical protein [Phycisphaeraceae bacterium]
MTMRAAFAQVDITPQVPCGKAGWLVKKVAVRVRDPLFVRVGVLEEGGKRLVLVSADLISIRWKEVEKIRDAAAKLGIDRQLVMVAATHNHCGPASASAGEVKRDQPYIDQVLVPRVVEALAQATERLRPARLTVAGGVEDRVAFIRRFHMRDGSVKTHPQDRTQIVCAESVLDPQLQVLGVWRQEDQTPLGFLVNYALHPTHFGGDDTLTAGWPGRMDAHIKRLYGPSCVGMLLNGCFGDVHHGDPCNPQHVDDMDQIGRILAEDVQRLFPEAGERHPHPALSLKKGEGANPEGLPGAGALPGVIRSVSCTLRLPWRDIDGPYGIEMRFRQRFGTDEIYEHEIESLRRKQAKKDHFPAEIQCLALGNDVAIVGLPCEPFSELGLRIKTTSPFRHTLVVGAANGMVGYVPTRRAFDGGGYECTLITSSAMAPEAGQMMVDAAKELLREVSAP